MGLVQALVFMLLTAVFTLLICQPHEDATVTNDSRRTTERTSELTWSAICTSVLAALGAALAVGIDRHEGVGGRRTQSRRMRRR